MDMTNHSKTKTTASITVMVLASAMLLNSARAGAQMAMPSSEPAQTQPQADASTQTQDTQAQINQLKRQVARLQAALQQSRGSKSGSTKGSMSGAKPATGMDDDSSEMGSMAPSDGSMKSDSATPMSAPGCCGMSMGKPMPNMGGIADDKMGGGMPSKSNSSMSASRAADAPHLLHVGAKDFFLDHAQHIGLMSDQRLRLERIKADTKRNKTASQKQIDVAEQELWKLTSAEQPNTGEIDMKVQEIAKLRADQQMAFIHAVSAASDVLTPEQRTAAVKAMASPNPAKSPMPKQPMKME